jgi:hypothetical protein
MQQLTTTATFTDGRFDDEALTTIVARSVLEAALVEDEKAQLWFELASDGEETRRLEIDLSTADLEEILRMSGGDDIALTFSGDDVTGLFEDADVEAQRVARSIAVTSAAILAPAGHAATTQSIGTASTTQGAGMAATTQSIGTAATTQGAGMAATAQVGTEATAQVANVAVKAQVAGAQAKLATSKTANLKAIKILRYGLAS